jgi:hypothetical protein
MEAINNNDHYTTDFDRIRDLTTKKSEKYSIGMQNAMTRAWADSTKGDNVNSKDVAEAVYNSARDFVLENLYGISMDTAEAGTKEFEQEIKNMVIQAVGYRKRDVTDALKDEDSVDAADVDQFIRAGTKQMGKRMDAYQRSALEELDDDELDPLKAYLVEMAKQVNYELDPDNVKDIPKARQLFGTLAQLVAQAEKQQEALKGLEKRLAA